MRKANGFNSPSLAAGREFIKLCDLMSEEKAKECLCNYIEGFKFGLLMGLEVAGGR